MAQTRHIIEIVLNSSTTNLKKFKEIMLKSKPSSKSKDADIMKVVSYLTEQEKTPTQAELKDVSYAIKYMEGEYMPSVISGVVKRIGNPTVALADIKQYMKNTLKDKNDYRWLLLKKHMNYMIKISTKEKKLKQRFLSILNHITKHLKKQQTMAMKGGTHPKNDEYKDEEINEDDDEDDEENSRTISLDEINDKILENADSVQVLRITKDCTSRKNTFTKYISNFKNLYKLNVGGLGDCFTKEMLSKLPNNIEIIKMKGTEAANDFAKLQGDIDKIKFLEDNNLKNVEVVQYGEGNGCDSVWVRMQSFD
jgi:hypothetical protein